MYTTELVNNKPMINMKTDSNAMFFCTHAPYCEKIRQIQHDLNDIELVNLKSLYW